MIPADLLNTVTVGDCRELARRLPDASVDMIFTDPPYPREYLPLYGWLGETAARVLKPGGYLFAYCGAETLPEVLALLQVPGLVYFWTIALLHSGGYPRLWYKRLYSGYKPVAVFTRGKPGLIVWQATTFTSKQEKRFHKWQQGAQFAIKTIETLTRPGDVVLDPFCGGGTTPAVCRMLERQFATFEIDSKAADVARRRVETAQAALFVGAAGGWQPGRLALAETAGGEA